MKPPVSRRSFLKTAGTAGVLIPFAMHGMPLYGFSPRRPLLADPSNDNILVLIQLQGGNDGLSTVFHAPQYENLNAVRQNILVRESDIIPVTGDYGFHPVMEGMKEMWDNESLCIIQNVGYPNQNRSHFRSTDIWNSASHADEFVATGWLGRIFEMTHADYPTGFPNPTMPHPFALTMGKIVSETCQGIGANFSLSLLDPYNPGTAYAAPRATLPGDCYGDKLRFVETTIQQTNGYAEVIKRAAEAGSNRSSKWETLDSELANKLKNVARLISGGLQTKVYIVQLGGFDTHDNQVVSGEAATGRQADLLRELSDAMCAFHDDIGLLGLGNRVAGMTYSEFGRRIRSNDSLGTDHGTAAPMFVFGSCVRGHIHGDHPTIDPQVGTEEGVPMQFDFRNMYGTILAHWLGVTEQEVRNVVYADFQPLPIFKTTCVDTTYVLNTPSTRDWIRLHPNPVHDKIHVTINPESFQGTANATLTMFDGLGSIVDTMARRSISSTNASITIDVSSLPPGAYVLRLESRMGSSIQRFVKQ